MIEAHAICYCGKPIHTEKWAAGMKPIWLHDDPRRVSCNEEGGLPVAEPASEKNHSLDEFGDE